MPRIYHTVPGGARQIGSYGIATAEFGVEVPPEVAAEFAGRPEYRVEGFEASGDLGVVVPSIEGGRLITLKPELVVPVAEAMAPRLGRRRKEFKGEEQ